jgi:hypothetical protein
MKKKDLIIVALATFCLTATLFMMIPTRSQPGGYDPWLDTNDDGSINILESILTGNHFLTSGDATKPVVTTGYNWSHGYYFATLAPGEVGSLNITSGGYRQITLAFRASPVMVPIYGNVSMATGFSMANTSKMYVNVDRFSALPAWTGPDLPILHEYPVVKAYEIIGEMLTVAYYNQNLDSFNLWVEYYMTA